VSLTLATDEALAELVPVERIAAVSMLADDAGYSNVAGKYPPGIPRVGAQDLERIIALRPDLVLVATYNSADFLEQLRRSGHRLHLSDPAVGFDEIGRSLAALGEAVGEPERGRALAEFFAARRAAFAKRLDGAKRPRVLTLNGMATAGKGTDIDDLIREAGGLNVASEAGLEGYPTLTAERIIALDPDWVLVSAGAKPETDPVLSKLRAVREGRVAAIEGRLLGSVSHHVLTACELLARKLHPDRFGP
jgi:iron complex transport system substrate-binding protein